MLMIGWKKHGGQAKSQKDEPVFPDSESLSDLIKIAYGDFIHLSILLSQMFFALEFSCRTLCSLGCYSFALKTLKDEIIQHNELWKQLKWLGTKRGPNCEICVARGTCVFGVDFLSLARIYSYSMKVRQVSDYTTRFASLNIFKSQLADPPFVYFQMLTRTVERNLLLCKTCVPERYSELIPKLTFFNEQRKNFYPPISLVNSMIERFFLKRKRSRNLR